MKQKTRGRRQAQIDADTGTSAKIWIYFLDDEVARLQREASAHGKQLTAAEAHGRAVILQCVVEGLASRAVRDPALRPATLRPVLQQVINALLS